MKIIKSNNKYKITKKAWESIGEAKGWVLAQDDPSKYEDISKSNKTTEYETLNEASKYNPGLEVGSTEIWYWKPEVAREALMMGISSDFYNI